MRLACLVAYRFPGWETATTRILNLIGLRRLCKTAQCWSKMNRQQMSASGHEQTCALQNAARAVARLGGRWRVQGEVVNGRETMSRRSRPDVFHMCGKITVLDRF